MSTPHIALFATFFISGVIMYTGSTIINTLEELKGDV
jgi:hypothetical protein